MSIGIIGHFGADKDFTDGQTVKTVTLYQACLKKGLTVHKADTYYIRHNPLRFAAQLLSAIINDRKIIVLLSKKGRKMLFPFLSWAQTRIGTEIYHYAIGGRLADEIEENPKVERYIATFSGNWMETHDIVQRLTDRGISNARYVPNFKQIAPLSEDGMTTSDIPPFRFCTFSRVIERKGISDAIFAINAVNRKSGYLAATLDIYGPVDKGYEAKFFSDLKSSEGSCRYCGIINPNSSVDVLSQYYMLLFPTQFYREGMPGTIIDALFAGLPIIARRWQYCDEMSEENVNGYVYNFETPKLLADKIEYAIKHTENMLLMKRACVRSAKQYSEEVVMEQILSEMHLQ